MSDYAEIVREVLSLFAGERTTQQAQWTKDTCPDVAKHTKCPSSYAQWHEWAEKKARRHYQTPCLTCGLYTIWKRKGKG